jgi:hypothetical protein
MRSVERNVHEVKGREVVRQGSGERPVEVVAPVLAQAHVEDAQLEHVPGLRALDRHRPGQDVRAERNAGFRRVDGAQLGRDVEAGGRKQLGASAHGLDGDPVAARDRERRRATRVEIAPVAGLRGGGEVMVAHRRLAVVAFAQHAHGRARGRVPLGCCRTSTPAPNSARAG